MALAADKAAAAAAAGCIGAVMRLAATNVWATAAAAKMAAWAAGLAAAATGVRVALVVVPTI